MSKKFYILSKKFELKSNNTTKFIVARQLLKQLSNVVSSSK